MPRTQHDFDHARRTPGTIDDDPATATHARTTHFHADLPSIHPEEGEATGTRGDGGAVRTEGRQTGPRP